MATLRSSFPSRLRQLLSAQGAMSPSIKLVSETPPEIQAFIDKVIMCPLQDIEIPLSGFRWEYGKGTFNHWRPLFLHFDTYFKAYISGRNDLLLEDELLEDDAPFPKQAVLQILRVMQIILDNCHNKVSFSGLEHFKLLLASTDPEILIASLETLSSLVKISPKLHFSGKLVGLGSINSCLLSLAQGWGSKEEGLGLYACVMLNEKSEEGGFSLFPSDVQNETDRSQYRVGSTLYLELHGVNSQNVKGSSVIHIPDLHLRKEDDLSLMEMCIKQYNVPPELRYLLLTRIRYAHSFRSSRICKLYSRICLLAFGVLVQAGDSHDKLVSFFANEPEYTNELIRIVKSEDTISGNIKTLAMHALGSQLAAYSSSQERALILSGSSISFSGTLKKLMDYSNSAMALFRDLGGVELLMNRLQIEVDRVINAAADDKLMNSGESSRHYDDMIYSQKRLIRVLLKALGSATYSPANTLRTQNNVSLPSTLSLIFKNLELFGGDIYSSAVSVMSEIIHKDPTCFPVLDELGLPDAFLSSVVVGILPSSKALMCVPNGLGAICLNAKGLDAVKRTTALRFLVDIFTNRKYVLAMSDAVVPLAKAVEELLRHVSSLKSVGVDLIIEIISKISLIGDLKLTAPPEKVIGSTSMETDTDNKENRSSSLLVGETDPTLGGVNNEQFIQLSIFHVMILVLRAMENSETCRLFVERSGIEALLKLLLRPTIAQSSEGMSIAFHSTMVFKGFTQHHSAPLARAFCSSLKDQLKKALTAFDTVAGSFLLDPKVTPDCGIFSSLFLVEFLLFLGASKESRWVNALLTEFGSGSKEVLEDIGRVQREVLWQVALLEDAKLQIKDDGTDSGVELRQPESSTNEVEDQRVNSFREFLDPLLSRRMSGWSFESQIFDLINMYHDLTHASGLQQRHGGNGTSDLRLGASQRLHQPGAAVSIGSSGKKEDDKQKSYYSSCCDMVKSLSSHITRLFQELGRAMFLPSRRRDDLVNVSPSSKSVASIVASIALGHMSFGGNVLSGLEASVSVKCRYFGKVIEFIDSILLDKPESCNPVMLNALYGRGVIQSVLTTFEATSQLLFTVNRTPASPMDTDEGILKQDDLDETGHSWIHGSLISYGKLMDHLVTSSFVLVPFTKHLLTQPLVNGDIPFPRDAETLVKVLQSATLKVLLPVWTHHQFSDCNHDFIATVVSIIRHIYSGVEVKNVSNAVSRSSGPPPSETTISTIVEMGFSRPRAEEALRQVGLNSVELAMEWLFSHPEEVQEDDELARALAMSLGSSGSDIREDLTNDISEQIEEEVVHLPPVGDLLSTCRKLLHMKDSLAFPVRDLLILICSRNNGEYRSIVISYIIEQVKLSSAISDSGTSNMLASLFHVIALILNEDVASREVASMNGLVKVASDILSDWSSGLHDKGISQVPKWVSAAFVAIDRLAQVDQKLSDDILELLKNGDDGSQRSLVINDEKPYKPGSANGLKYIDIQEQKSLVEIACSCMRYELPSQTTHAVLQLCSSLTRSHSVALSFLDAGGLPLLLSLPTSSMFVGFDNVAAAIIRHILEDPQTLQQSMEHEIKHSIATAANRQSNGRLTPHNFLLNLTSVISRDPVIFLRAAQSVCQVEMVSERPYIVLLKDREKDKLKEKGKEKERGEEKDKSQSTDGKGVHGKLIDINSKNAKVHRKPPQSFVNVIELLLDSIITFFPMKNEMASGDCSSSIDMDIDVAASKGKGKAVASAPEEIEVNKQESSASVAKIVFILKLLTEILMMYGSSVHVLLRKDAEVISCRSLPHKGTAGMCSDGILYHILHEFLPCSQNSRKDKKIVVDWRHKLASNAGQFLVATCVRSAEARKRVFMEIGYVFKDFVDSSEGFRPPESIIQAFVDFINDVLVARTPTGSCISAEASVTFIDLGLVRSISRALHILDLDHGDSPKVASGIVKILDVVTKEHVQAAENNAGKVESSTKPSEQGPAGRTDSGPNTSQAMETILQPNVAYVPTDHVESINTVHIFGGSENITDDMEHDQDYDGGSALPNEDDYMHETSDDARVLQTGLNTIGVTFEIQTDVNENLEEDDDEDMSGDEGEEDDEDGDHEEHNNLEEEVAYLPHPDTDQDDHENDEDEFDEEIMEEDDDEDDDDDEDEGLILRLGDGMNGTNMLDQIEAFDSDQNISNELHVMPVDLFGSRRQGRTTSIYNLLGRTGDSASTTQHPLLEEPVSALRSIPPRRLDSVRDIFAARNSESSSLRMDSIFRSLRTGRHAHRLNLWGDNNHQSGGSSASAVPQGLEDLLVSRLTLAEPKKPSGENTVVEPHSKGEAIQPQQDMIVETAAGDNRNSETNYTTPVPSSTSPDASASCHIRPAVNGLQQVADLSLSLPQSVEMQFEHSDAVGQDVEAVSLAGSEATVGESLRGLDVEVGHDDAAERQGEADTRTRRVNMSFGNAAPLSGTDVPLHSANEVSGHPSQEAGQAATAEEQQNGDADSRSIDPAFLDALPEELRAEVLSAQQGQTAQPSNTEPESQNEDIDPEFLAALPPEIREEVLAQQQAQRLHQSRELEGQPVEMDTVSIIATFPSELREEVLLTSSDAILANLTPALVAEANMLRERFAHRYNGTLFGMHARNRRGESSRRGDGIGSILDRTGGVIIRRSLGSKAVEADGAPLVDTEDLKALVRLLRVVQPLYKGHLQRLLLNLCAHNETRTALVKILVEFLMLDMRRPTNLLGSLEPSFRLYACQSHVAYSRPQYFDGVPPLVSRRVLETLTYLARSHPLVAKLFFQFSMHQSAPESSSLDMTRGKAVMVDEDKIEKLEHQEEHISIKFLLSLLNQPLYLRSIAHLEQLLNLLDVIIDNAESKPKSSDAPGPSLNEQVSTQITTSDAEINTGSAGTSSGSDARSSKADDTSKLPVSNLKRELDSEDILRNLPREELRFLCSLLAREGLSDKAYALVAEVLKKLVTIVPVHCHLLISELAGSIQNLTKSAMNELHIFGEVERAIPTATSSDGAAVLRVLQAVSSLVATLSVKDKNGQVLSEKEHAAALALLGSINASLDPLWLELSTCVGKIERYSDSPHDLLTSSVASTSKPPRVMHPLPAGTQNILPYLESFFVMCEKLNPLQSGTGHDLGGDVVSDVEEATTSDSKPKASGSAHKVDEKQIAFIKFSDKHKKLLNAFIRQNPGLLEKSFSLMLKVPRVIDFDNKRAHFRSKIKHDHHHSALRISVRRAYILEDSYNQLRMRSAQDLRGRLNVHFQGEEGIDAGGLTREWYQLLSRVIFDKGALLFTTVGNESTFQPNPNSVYQTEHLSYFKFVGRVVAKALLDGQLLDVHFTRSFYKHILGVKVTYHDIEAIDPDYFKNLKWMLENDISDILDLTFSIDADEEKLILYERAQVTDYELCENGRNIRVTEENKHEYVDLVAEHRLTTAIRPQINAFLEGFNELIQRDLISIFNDKELELLISGLPDIDLDDMRMNTEYSGYSVASPVIQWFWEVVRGFSKEDKARLLQFVTGTSKVPLEGFSALQGISGSQKFQIHKAYGSTDHLPSAHTCFNQLDLPEYPTKQHLEERLLLAIHEANEGFGFG
ncbi:E3 ubiquitin-protein ligase UPL1 [Heracleum sosnowskyi]|uniref:HECT-type E3 ubiquitin transferase n=1 Tax=Heracleum sosnowskyi TaxID=360622 RepID=A0AAD8N249_9APIA|nr:E3 ubiquitin-protein ligase UPL1 [Heracleum sosnowskyi]